jgi:hypothetical protein
VESCSTSELEYLRGLVAGLNMIGLPPVPPADVDPAVVVDLRRLAQRHLSKVEEALRTVDTSAQLERRLGVKPVESTSG